MLLCHAPRCRGDDEPRETSHSSYLCTVCTGRLRWRIAELPALVRWLHAHLTPERRGESDKVTGSAEPPMPLRTDVLSVIGPASLDVSSNAGGLDQDDSLPNIPTELYTWCRLTAEERDLYGPTRVDPETCATWLLGQLDWIVTQPWCAELLDEVARMHATAGRLAPWSEQRYQLDGACPSCDLKALVRHEGAIDVECDSRQGGCGRQWDEHDLPWLARTLYEEAS